MAKVPANKKLQVTVAVLFVAILMFDHFVLSDLVKNVSQYAKSNGISQNQITVFIMVIANIIMLCVPGYCLLLASKTKRHKKYPYPGMLVFIDTDELTNQDAINKSKSLFRAAGYYLATNIVITIGVLEVLGVINVM